MNKERIIIVGIILIVLILIVAGIVILSKSNELERLFGSTSNSNVEEDENGGESIVTWHVEEDGSKCPVPEGYVGSEATGENEINTGYVIYEGTEEVTDENVEEAKTTRNQYVWVPVSDVSQMYGTDENGKKWGKLYYFATSSDDENFDKSTGTYPDGWSENNGIMKISKYDDREPEVVDEYDYSIKSGVKIEEEQLEEEFNSMIESVEKYGGFYIGRYETGNLSQNTAVVMQGNTDIADTTWYNSYKLCKKLSGDNKNVETGLIWGCQWDRTLMWLIESGNKTKTEITTLTSWWGNHVDSEFEYTDSNGYTTIKSANSMTRIPTGSTEYTKANNIYDLAGNVWE